MQRLVDGINVAREEQGLAKLELASALSLEAQVNTAIVAAVGALDDAVGDQLHAALEGLGTRHRAGPRRRHRSRRLDG